MSAIDPEVIMIKVSLVILIFIIITVRPQQMQSRALRQILLGIRRFFHLHIV